MKAFIGRSLSGRTPGAGERGDEGSLRGLRGGERFYSRAGVQAGSSHIREKARATAAGGVQGLRVGTCLDQAAGGRSRKFSQPLELVCGIFPGHASTCPTFH